MPRGQTKRATHAYRAVQACGCIDGLATDTPVMADEIARWVKAGLSVERVTIAQARDDGLARCG